MSDDVDAQAGSDPVTQAQFKKYAKATDERLAAIEAQVGINVENIAVNQENIAANAAAIDVLEEGGEVVPPDPPDPTDGEPSPDGTEATAPGVVLVSSGLNTFELVNLPDASRDYGIGYNGTLDQATHHVSRLYAKGGRIYQEAQGHWYVSNDDGTWNPTSDPTKEDTVPIPPGPDPEPPLVGEFVAVYTTGRGSSGSWNFGTGNDDEMCDAIEAVEREIGRQVQGYGFFSMYGSMDDWPGNYGWAIKCMLDSRLGSRLRIPVIGVFPYWSSVAPEFYGWNDDRALQDVVNGRWDSMYRSLARAVYDAGAREAIWRLAYECNANFMCAAPNWSQESETLWARAFEQMSHCVRDESAKVGLKSTILFNPTLGSASHSLEYMTPSPEAYDVWAADSYNGYWGQADQADNDQARRDYWAKNWLGMEHAIAYAKQYGKPMMLPETGAGARDDGAGKADSANFWHWEAEQMTAARAQGIPYWGAMLWDVSPSDGHFR